MTVMIDRDLQPQESDALDAAELIGRVLAAPGPADTMIQTLQAEFDALDRAAEEAEVPDEMWADREGASAVAAPAPAALPDVDEERDAWNEAEVADAPASREPEAEGRTSAAPPDLPRAEGPGQPSAQKPLLDRGPDRGRDLPSRRRRAVAVADAPERRQLAVTVRAAADSPGIDGGGSPVDAVPPAWVVSEEPAARPAAFPANGSSQPDSPDRASRPGRRVVVGQMLTAAGSDEPPAAPQPWIEPDSMPAASGRTVMDVIEVVRRRASTQSDAGPRRRRRPDRAAGQAPLHASAPAEAWTAFAMPSAPAVGEGGGSASSAPPGEAGRGSEGGAVILDGRLVGEWIAEHLAREAGRPAAGPTFFDVRQGPAWTPSGVL